MGQVSRWKQILENLQWSIAAPNLRRGDSATVRIVCLIFDDPVGSPLVLSSSFS